MTMRPSPGTVSSAADAQRIVFEAVLAWSLDKARVNGEAQFVDSLTSGTEYVRSTNRVSTNYGDVVEVMHCRGRND